MAFPPSNSRIRQRRIGRYRPARRDAAVTLEAILTIPLLVIALFAAFEFGMILTVQHTLNHAVIEAAREAAKVTTNNAFNDDLRDTAASVADSIVSVHGLTVSCTGSPDVQIIVEDSTAVKSCGPSPDIVTPPGSPSIPGYLVRVHLAVELDSIPIPNLLDYFGFDLSGKYLYVTSDAIKEAP